MLRRYIEINKTYPAEQAKQNNMYLIIHDKKNASGHYELVCVRPVTEEIGFLEVGFDLKKERQTDPINFSMNINRNYYHKIQESDRYTLSTVQTKGKEVKVLTLYKRICFNCREKLKPEPPLETFICKHEEIYNIERAYEESKAEFLGAPAYGRWLFPFELTLQ